MSANRTCPSLISRLQRIFRRERNHRGHRLGRLLAISNAVRRPI